MDQQRLDNCISFETYLFCKEKAQTGNEVIIALINFSPRSALRDEFVNRYELSATAQAPAPRQMLKSGK